MGKFENIGKDIPVLLASAFPASPLPLHLSLLLNFPLLITTSLNRPPSVSRSFKVSPCFPVRTQDQNKKQWNKQAQRFEFTLLSLLFSFSVGNGEFHFDGKDGSFIFLTWKNGDTIKILIFVWRMIILMQTLVELSWPCHVLTVLVHQ